MGKIDLRGMFVGRTLYRNGRRILEIQSATRIPRHNRYVFLWGHDCTGRGVFHFILTDIVALMMRHNGGSAYWNGDLLQIRYD